MGCSQSNTSKVFEGTSAWVKFEDDWLAQGTSRLVYRGTFHGDTNREGNPCVVKVYKQEWYDGGQYAWKADESAYLKAQEMAQLFNIKYNTSKHTEFVKPEFTSIKTLATKAFQLPLPSWFTFRFPSWCPSCWCPPCWCPSCWLTSWFQREKEVKGIQEGTKDKVSNVIPENATLAVESYIDPFIKFSSNTGYVNPDNIGSSPSAFSHYTYHESDGEILVCGLQGKRGDRGYKFTSPVIHSGGTELGVYGPTDLGKFGIVKFFENHTCNVLCTGLKKAKLVDDPLNETELMHKIVRSMPEDQTFSMNTHQLSDVTDVPLHEIEQAQRRIKLLTG